MLSHTRATTAGQIKSVKQSKQQQQQQQQTKKRCLCNNCDNLANPSFILEVSLRK